MELQIKELVDSIKKEGIDAANAEAESIIAKAKAEAADIVAKANAEADAVRKKSESDINLLKESAETSIEHAKRDAVLSFRDSVRAEFEKLLSCDIEKSVNGETLAKLIFAAIADENPADYAAEVKDVTDGLRGELANEIKNGLEIRVNPKVHSGFRLASKDGSGYFDCSDEEITKMLAPFFPELEL